MSEASPEVLSDLAPTGKLRVGLNMPGSRILDGNFTAVQQAAGTPKGRSAGAQYLREFIEEVKESGRVAKAIEDNGVRGLTVAPAAVVQAEGGAE